MQCFSRRQIAGYVSALPLVLLGSGATAQAYPAKLVKVIVPYGPGTVSDATARLMAERLSEYWGVAVVVENQTGAGGVLGTQAIARAVPDGYTLGMLSSNHAINAALYPNLPYDPVKDFKPILHTTFNQFAFCVNPALPVQTLQELLALAKARPGEIAYSSSGNGGSPHLAVAKLAYMANVQLTHVPYKTNGAGVIDLISGQVALMATSVSVLAPHVKAGKLRALAVSGDSRSSLLPNVPTVNEAGVPGYSMVNWNGFVGPAGLSSAIVSKLQSDMTAVLKEQRSSDRIAAMGAEIEILASDDFERKLRTEIGLWTRIVKAAGVKMD